VMGWHLLTWLLAWRGASPPRAWELSFVITQTLITSICVILWLHFAPRWIKGVA